MSEPLPAARTVIIQDDSLRTLCGFTQIPNVVLKHPSLSPGAKIAYGVLLSYAWQEGFCWPAQTRLADDMNVSRRQVIRLLDELRTAKLIDWKQRGLNRPNIYYILPISTWSGPNPLKNMDVPNPSHPEAPDLSHPDATSASLQEAPFSSHKEDSEEKIQKVVNVVTGNDHKSLKGQEEKKASERHLISDRVLSSKYRFTDAEIDRVRYLVDKQVQVLGEESRNHRAYVKRSAEAVATGVADLLDVKLSELKQVALSIAIRSRPAYFHRIWLEALAKRQLPAIAAVPDQEQRVPPTQVSAVPKPTVTSAVSPLPWLRDRIAESDQPASDEQTRARFTAAAENQGLTIPAGVRDGGTAQLKRWYAQQVLARAEERNAAPGQGRPYDDRSHPQGKV